MIVEFLAVSILVVAAVLTLVQLAMWSWARNVALSAAHEGARVAAEAGRPLSDGSSRTRLLLHDGLGARADQFVVDSAEEGDTVAVVARGDAPAIVPFLPRFVVTARATAFDEDAVFGP